MLVLGCIVVNVRKPADSYLAPKEQPHIVGTLWASADPGGLGKVCSPADVCCIWVGLESFLR
jgi:hypothetical protein